jgi:transposase
VYAWLVGKKDARSLDHKTLEELRTRAVECVQAGEPAVDVARAIGVRPESVYRWLASYRAGGWHALRAKPIPGRPRILDGKAMQWIYQTVVTKDPRQLKFPYALWTRKIIGEVIAEKFGVQLSLKSIGKLLAQLGLSVQRPLHRAFEQDATLVQRWLKTEYPKIAKAAKKAGASIFFGDEAGVRSDYHSGTTWAPIGQTPVVRTTGQRFGCNMISAVSAKGELRFMITRGGVNADVFIMFLRRLLYGAKGPVFLIVDGHPTHRAKKTRAFVESTQGKLQLFTLPSYSPELNPDELVWRHVKAHRVGRMGIRNRDDLEAAVRVALRSLSRMPYKIKAFFNAPTTRYAFAA